MNADIGALSWDRHLLPRYDRLGTECQGAAMSVGTPFRDPSMLALYVRLYMPKVLPC